MKHNSVVSFSRNVRARLASASVSTSSARKFFALSLSPLVIIANPLSDNAFAAGKGGAGSSSSSTLAAPSNLVATAISSNQIQLNWQDNSTSETGFKIERAPTSNGTWVQIVTVGASVTVYTNSALNPATPYYRVRAYNQKSNPGYSGVASATTLPVGPPCTYAIAVSGSPSAGGLVAGGDTVSCNTPNAGYNFANWTENGTLVSSSASYSFTAGANRTLVANFSTIVPTYTITTSASPASGGTTTGPTGPVNSGTSVTVTATPATGHKFANRTENGTVVSATANYTFTANANRTLVANFTAVAPPSGSPVGCWPFDTGTVSGTTAQGVTTLRNNATLVGSALPTIVPGKTNQAVNLDGVSDLVSVPDSTSLNITGPFTVATWVNFNALPGSSQYPNLVAKLTSPSGNFGYGLFWYGSGVSAIIGSGSSSWNIPQAAPAYVAVFDGATLSLYVNGAYYFQTPASAPAATSEVSVQMGAHYSNPSVYGYIKGKPDDARIYSRALSASEIAQLYTSAGSSTPPLVTISTSVSPSGGGTVSGGGSISCGSNVRVTATAASCYQFVSWMENGTVVRSSASYTFAANANRSLVDRGQLHGDLFVHRRRESWWQISRVPYVRRLYATNTWHGLCDECQYAPERSPARDQTTKWQKVQWRYTPLAANVHRYART